MSISLEQALFLRPDGDAGRLLARSAGFTDAWLPDAERIMHGFGERRGRRCPLAVFAVPIAPQWIVVVRVMEDAGSGGLRFHFLAIEQSVYTGFVRDPFMLADKIDPTWDAVDALPTLMLPKKAFGPRSVALVQGVLKRVKAGALKEGEDPEAPGFDRTVENSESPALLGGAQVLVDGGRLIFERPTGDLRLVSGLWLLLPEATRTRLWPASFAFGTELDFDVVVVPRVDSDMLDGYTTEDQAADYPDGAYELALQHAAEAGSQEELDRVFSRRDGRQTIRLALILLATLSLLVIVMRWPEPPAPPRPLNPLPIREQQVAAAAGILAVGDPLTSVSMLAFAKQTWKKGGPPRDAR